MKVLILLLLGLVLAYSQSQTSSNSPSFSPSPTQSNDTYSFVCQKVNQYDFRTWYPMGNFLSLDAGAVSNWTLSQQTASCTTKVNGQPTGLMSPDVWTGRVTFTGYMETNGTGNARRIGILFGVVSPQTKFLLLEWSNDAASVTGCVPPVVQTQWGRTLSGIVLRAIINPLGDSALQQECNLGSPVDQPNVTQIWYSQPSVSRREIMTPYWFNLTVDTFNNSISYSIYKTNSTGRQIVNGTISVANHALSGNFSLGRIGAFVSGGAGIFYNWTVTPLTCDNNYYANCGYFCPNVNTTLTYSEEKAGGRNYDNEGPNEPMHWYAILLIILAILICCCLICVIIAAVVVFLRR